MDWECPMDIGQILLFMTIEATMATITIMVGVGMLLIVHYCPLAI